MIRVARILGETMAEGPGRRFTIWVQGCALRCKGCYAEKLWDPDGGYPVPAEALNAMIAERAERLEGITLLGGEPFLQAEELAETARCAKDLGLSVICFSGYTLEKLRLSEKRGVRELLASTDVLIDGSYIEEQRDFSRPLVGSKNQRFHFLTPRYSEDDMNGFHNKIEFRIGKDGVLRVNGMGDFTALEKILV